MKIKEVLLKDKVSYASDNVVLPENGMDCSQGCNPYGIPCKVKKCLTSIKEDDISNYPHNQNIYNAICSYWKDYSSLTYDNILLTDGSIGGIYVIVNAFSKPNAKILGVSPQFSDFCEYAKSMDMIYDYETLKSEDNYSVPIDEIYNQISDEYSLVYLDMPNNPTGQSIPLKSIEKILAKALKHDVYVIIDEAYGDFISKSESSIALFDKYENLIVIRSFSKGFGLAGVRGGYIISNPKLTKVTKKLSNPYMMNEIARQMCIEALDDEAFIDCHVEDFVKSKEAIRTCTGGNILMAKTDDRVPICMLKHVNDDIDLSRLLFDHGVLVVSGVNFESLNKSFVRMRMPKYEDINFLVNALNKIN